MLTRSLALAAGVACALFWVSWPALCTVLGAGAVLIGAAVSRLRLPLVFFIIGAAWCSWHIRVVLAQRLAVAHTTVVHGCVVSAVRVNAQRLRFDMRLHASPTQPARQRVRLSWYNPGRVPAAGECWRLAVTLRPPRGRLNPYGWDFERYAFMHRLAAVGVVRELPAPLRVSAAHGRSYVLRARLALAARVRFAAGEGALTPLYTALTVGLRHAIDQRAWHVMNTTGTTHLMAISGLHVGLLAGIGFAFGRWLLGPVLRCRCTQDAGWVCAMVSALAYATLAGFAVPTQRALIMVSVFALGALLRRHYRTLDSLALGLLLVLLLDPLAMLGAGLWLSFGAVAALLTLIGRRNRTVWRSQFAVFLALAPMLGALSGRLSLVSPLANAVCVPLFSLVIIPLSLFGALLTLLWLPAAMALYGLLDTLLGSAWYALAGLAAVPAAAVALSVTESWQVALALAAATAALTVVVTPRARVVAAVACVPLLFGRAPGLAHGAFVVQVYDVGQALGVSVRTRRHALVYDTGGRWHTGDSGSDVLLVQLRALGVRKLNKLIVSHADLDHRGGALSLLDAMRTGRVYSGEPLTDIPRAQPCRQRHSWTLDGVNFEFLHPDNHPMWVRNNASCVLSVASGFGRVLLTGDAEGLGELALLAGGQSLRADALIGQHHGSATSSTAAFVSAVRPRVVVFSTGFGNRWSLPAPAVTRRWQEAGARVFDTGRDGALTLTFARADRVLDVRAERAGRPGVWRP